MSNQQWDAAQEGEAGYWGNCNNFRTWGEFTKGELYGREMDLYREFGDAYGELNMQGRSILDVGGGPISMTLRCYNSHLMVVADPITWPPPVHRRYLNAGIQFLQVAGEDLPPPVREYDEVWIYNVLQHVRDPQQVIEKAKAYVAQGGGRLRIFEWLNIPADKCHPHVLTEMMLCEAFQDMCAHKIVTPVLNEYWAVNAQAFAGVFSRRT